MTHHSPSFLDIRTRNELLAHRLALCDREDEILRHFYTFMSPNERRTMANQQFNAQLEDEIEAEPIDLNLAIISYGRQFNKSQRGQQEGLSGDQVEKAITALAWLHALSMGSPQFFGPNSVLPHFSQPKHENELAIKNWLLNLLLTLPNCEYFRKNERPLRNFLQNVKFELIDEKEKTNAEKDLPIVLCHGNFCGDNIIICPKGETQHREGLPSSDNWPNIRGWELAYLGYGISDLAHLLLSSVNSSLRIHFLDQWIALYVHKFEQFRQIQRNGKGGGNTMPKVLANKNKLERIVKRQKQQFQASLPGQFLRVLPKLATDYRKLAEAKANPMESEQNQWKGCELLGRMIGGFEMIRKDFERRN
ncbi:hypothetical protein niasHS_005759 [Heterodera schachtii]|uniref:Aminoglycoside phosphotransferase domain-containing protein n=2 Tax=Heterodera TaxID=34509 RepID=A0ABD2JZE2_HETSC